MNRGGKSLFWIIGTVAVVLILVLVFAYTIGPAADGNDAAGGVATAIIKGLPVIVIIGVIGLIATIVTGRRK